MELIKIDKNNITENDLSFIMSVEQRMLGSHFKRKNLDQFKNFLQLEDKFFSKAYLYLLKDDGEYLGAVSFLTQKDVKPKRVYINFLDSFKNIENGIEILSMLEDVLIKLFKEAQIFIDIKNIKTKDQETFMIKIVESQNYSNMRQFMDVLNQQGLSDQDLNMKGIFEENYVKDIS